MILLLILLLYVIPMIILFITAYLQRRSKEDFIEICEVALTPLTNLLIVCLMVFVIVGERMSSEMETLLNKIWKKIC